MPCMYVCSSGVCAYKYYFLSLFVYVCVCLCRSLFTACCAGVQQHEHSAQQCSAYFLIEFTDVDDQICSNQLVLGEDRAGVHVVHWVRMVHVSTLSLWIESL